MYTTPNEVTKMDVFKKQCPKCGKEITSLYPEQLEQNYDVHIAACKKKGVKNG